MPAVVTITYLIETAPPCDIEIMEQMGWEFITVAEHKGMDTGFFITNIEK